MRACVTPDAVLSGMHILSFHLNVHDINNMSSEH